MGTPPFDTMIGDATEEEEEKLKELKEDGTLMPPKGWSIVNADVDALLEYSKRKTNDELTTDGPISDERFYVMKGGEEEAEYVLISEHHDRHAHGAAQGGYERHTVTEADTLREITSSAVTYMEDSNRKRRFLENMDTEELATAAEVAVTTFTSTHSKTKRSNAVDHLQKITKHLGQKV